MTYPQGEAIVRPFICSAVLFVILGSSQDALARESQDVNSSQASSVPNVMRAESLPDNCGAERKPLKRMSGEGRLVGLLLDFPDRPANRIAHPASLYNDLLFSEGTLSTRSLREYYLEQSYGKWEVSGAVYGWYRAEDEYDIAFNDHNFGGSGGSRSAGLEAMIAADPDVDFGLFDSDGPDGVPNSGDDDGIVDACMVFVSGLSGVDTQDPSDFWPIIVSIFPFYQTDDTSASGGFIEIESFSIQPEANLGYNPPDTLSSHLAVVTHEYGHIGLGLPDLYDGSNATWGIGYWGLMGRGAYGYRRTGPYQLSAWCKEQLGWVTPDVVNGNMNGVVLPPVETDAVVYKIWPNGTPGSEYFLLENRQKLLFDENLPGHGLLVWHVDMDMLNDPGAKSAPGFDFFLGLEQADGLNQMNTYFERPDREDYYPEIGDEGDPFPGSSNNVAFDASSTPSSLDNNGLTSGVSLLNITEIGMDIHLDIQSDPITAILIRDFRAQSLVSGVQLTWRISRDEPIAGLRIYRRSGGSGSYELRSGHSLMPPEQESFFDQHLPVDVDAWYAVAAVRDDGSEWISPEVHIRLQPPPTALLQNYPNPFNPNTRITFTLRQAGHVNLSLFDSQGRLIKVLLHGSQQPGKTSVLWNGTDTNGLPVPSQIYFYRLSTRDGIWTRKLTLLR